MKLYELSRGSHFRVEEQPKQPPDEYYHAHPDQEFQLETIDGMYSRSKDEQGNIVYFAAATEVNEV